MHKHHLFEIRFSFALEIICQRSYVLPRLNNISEIYNDLKYYIYASNQSRLEEFVLLKHIHGRWYSPGGWPRLNYSTTRIAEEFGDLSGGRDRCRGAGNGHRQSACGARPGQGLGRAMAG